MLSKSIQELYKIFNFLNTELFKDECVLPVICIQQNKSKRPSLGWCTVNQVWKDKTEKTYYEITICAEFLNRKIEEITSTVLHEMVHLHNLQNEVKDCSNNNVYHNKKFKQTAEEKGLVVSKEKTIGWGITHLNDATKELLKKATLDDTAFNYFRDRSLNIPTTPPQTSYKYECPCGHKFSLYKELNIVCKECNEIFEITKKEK